HLNRDETIGYIKHRLNVAGAKREIFNDEAAGSIYRASNGRPRQINNICDMALLVGSMRNASEINGQIIGDVQKDLGEEI
ncbi:MAG: hypothetical protein WBC00_02600, partial [Candidatus Omnitrophota bacterium]